MSTYQGPDEDEDNSPTIPMERPSVSDVAKYASETQLRCAMRLEHMVAAQKRRAK